VGEKVASTGNVAVSDTNLLAPDPSSIIPRSIGWDDTTNSLVDYAKLRANNSIHGTLWRNVLDVVIAAEMGKDGMKVVRPEGVTESLNKIVDYGYNEKPRWGLELPTTYLSDRNLNRYMVKDGRIVDLAPELCFAIGENIGNGKTQTSSLLGVTLLDPETKKPDPIEHNRAMAFITMYECRQDEAIKLVESGKADEVLAYAEELRSAAETPKAAEKWAKDNGNICLVKGDSSKPAKQLNGQPMTELDCASYAYDAATFFVADHIESGKLAFSGRPNASLTEPKSGGVALTAASMTRGIDASSVEPPNVPMPTARPSGIVP